jgi:hypothetical protein
VSEILKGNFKVKNEVKLESDDTTVKSSSDTIQQELKKKALGSIGGSMVYMERTRLSWDGDDQSGS